MAKLKNLVKDAVKILRNPEREFSLLDTRTLEDVVYNYIRLLLMISVIAGVVNLFGTIIRTIYYVVFLKIGIDYPRLINYALGQAYSTAFFYIIAGTFLMALLSLLLRVIVTKMKYTELLKRMLYSSTPVLIFGWTPALAVPLLIWGIFLFLIGIQYHRKPVVSSTSIEQRD